MNQARGAGGSQRFWFNVNRSRCYAGSIHFSSLILVLNYEGFMLTSAPRTKILFNS